MAAVRNRRTSERNERRPSSAYTKPRTKVHDLTYRRRVNQRRGCHSISKAYVSPFYLMMVKKQSTFDQYILLLWDRRCLHLSVALEQPAGPRNLIAAMNEITPRLFRPPLLGSGVSVKESRFSSTSNVHSLAVPFRAQGRQRSPAI